MGIRYSFLSGVAAFLLSSVAWASSYFIFLEAKIGSRKPIQGRVKVLEGQEGIVSTRDTLIKLAGRDLGNDRGRPASFSHPTHFKIGSLTLFSGWCLQWI